MLRALGSALVLSAVACSAAVDDDSSAENGDAGSEANETFRVTLSNISSNATLFKFTGTGTITNDD